MFNYFYKLYFIFKSFYPKQTFFNLPEEKRNKIINISLLEFAQHSYRAASVSRIVEKVGIAKGSMYQYFKNKKGLYLYLIDFTTNRKLSYLERHLDSSIEDFYELYKQMIFLAVKYDLGNIGKVYLLIMHRTTATITIKK